MAGPTGKSAGSMAGRTAVRCSVTAERMDARWVLDAAAPPRRVVSVVFAIYMRGLEGGMMKLLKGSNTTAKLRGRPGTVALGCRVCSVEIPPSSALGG